MAGKFMQRLFRNKAAYFLALSLLLPAVTPSTGVAETIRDCDACPELVQQPVGTAIGKTLVTKAQFAFFAKETGFKSEGGCTVHSGAGWRLEAAANWESPGFEQAEDHPVVCVTWLDAVAYAEWLTEKTGKPYRLLTFAESDAIAHPGGATFPWGEKLGDVCTQANIADMNYRKAFPNEKRKTFACDDHYSHTSPVTAFPPTAEGFHDVVGNAWEWTNDCMKGDCSNAVFRGGGWDVPNAERLKIGNSFGGRVLLRNFVIGLRVMRDRS